jgi:hypothetical protein
MTTIEPEAAATFGLPSVPLVNFRHNSSPPWVPASALLRLVTSSAAGGPRSRSVRRRIAANSARGTATSANWNTT